MAKNYKYIKRSDISVLKATIDGKVLNVDPKDILSGSYVAKKIKSTAKKIRVAKVDSSKLRDKILNYAKKFYKKEYEEKLDPVYDSKVTNDDLDKFIACGLTEEMIMAFYCGFKSIMDIKSDGEFNYGFSGGIFVFQTEGGYIERHIKRAIYNCENNVYELGFKYPTFNWKSAGLKMSKTEIITSAEYEGWRNTKKQAILKIETFKVKSNFTVLAVKDIGEVVDGKAEARYGQDELLDPKKPLDLNNDYLALVSRNGKELFALAKKLLSQTEGYVKDFDWLVQSKTFGAEMLTESKYKFAKGGEVIFTDLSDNTQSRKEWEGRKSKTTNQNSVGSFSHKVNNRMVGSYYIYRLDDFDEKYYSHIPLKEGEILVRVETDNMVGGEMPLVKINISNGRVYFMSEDNDLNSDYDDKNPKFNKASADVLYLSLDNALKQYESYSKKLNRKMAKGGSTYAKGGGLDIYKYVLQVKLKSGKTISKEEFIEGYGGNFKYVHRVILNNKKPVSVDWYLDNYKDGDLYATPTYNKGGSTYAEGGEIKVGTKVKYPKAKMIGEIVSIENDSAIPNEKSVKVKYKDGKEVTDLLSSFEVVQTKMAKGGSTYARGGEIDKNQEYKGAVIGFKESGTGRAFYLGNIEIPKNSTPKSIINLAKSKFKRVWFVEVKDKNGKYLYEITDDEPIMVTPYAEGGSIETITRLNGNRQEYTLPLPKISILTSEINDTALTWIEDNTGLKFRKTAWAYEAQPQKSEQIVKLLTMYGFVTEFHNNATNKNVLFLKFFKDEFMQYAKGGEIDYFEEYEKLPKKAASIVEKYQEMMIDGDYDYNQSAKFLEEMEAEGFTFEYGLDNEPFNLRKMAKGGSINDYLKIKGVGNYIDQKEALAKDLSKLNKDKRYYVIHNPSIGAVEIIDQKFFDIFTGKEKSVVGTKDFTIFSEFINGNRTPKMPHEYSLQHIVPSTYAKGGVVYLYYGGEQDDKTIKVSSQAEADKIAMENGAEHWDYVEDYAEGGGVDFDPISYAKNAGKDAIDWMQELKNYAGEHYDSLTAEEKDSIISELQMDYDFSHSFKTGGNLQKVLEKRGYDSESDINKDNMSRQEAREIRNEVDEMNKEEMNKEKTKKLLESARKRGLIK